MKVLSAQSPVIKGTPSVTLPYLPMMDSSNYVCPIRPTWVELVDLPSFCAVLELGRHVKLAGFLLLKDVTAGLSGWHTKILSLRGHLVQGSWQKTNFVYKTHIKTLRGRIWEIILSLRFFFFKYEVVYSLQVSGRSESLAVYGYSWIAFFGLILLFQVFTITTRTSMKFQLFLGLFQGVLFLILLAAIVVTIVFTDLSVGDCCRHITGLHSYWMGNSLYLSSYKTDCGEASFMRCCPRGLEISIILADNRPNANT
ncbi:hypothetical protein R1sor_015956 [Riccia sorocarpa]|uniref:Uncharacterized protein n=1 Tax=Riccia sorocarpa TaxID=122646 RepID=A0ABD3HGE4_9MARC